MNWQTALAATLPENLLLLGIVVLIGVEIATPRPRGALRLSLAVVIAAALAALWLHFSGFTADAFPGHFSVDPLALGAKAVLLTLAVPLVLLAREDFDDGRFYVLLLASLYGVCLIASADSFLTLFLAIELMSIPVYALVLMGFRRPECAEAALKYLVLSGTASATLLMGASLLYGSSETLALSAFADALAHGGMLGTTGVALVLVALFLKAAVVPFHGWAPDAYEAASVPVTAYMATLIKAGVLVATLRLFADAPIRPPVVALIAVLPLASIVWGNLTAMRQDSFRRMIAYSSIAHAGYLFYAFLGDGDTRFQAVLFYVVAYGLMNTLAFASLPGGRDDASRDRLQVLRGLWHRDPFAAMMIGIAMLSLAGIPPFPGFVAKFLIFRNVVAAGYTTYAVLGLVGSYLGIYFYLRVIQAMFMAPSPAAAPIAPGPAAARPAAATASVLCLLAALALTVFPGWLIGHLVR